MNVLTRMPRHLRTALAEADPARHAEIGERPDADALIARAEAHTPLVVAALGRPRRMRTLAPVAATVAVVAVASGVALVRADQGHRPAGRSQAALAAAFPVSADPRPVVLVDDSVLVPYFPDGATKNAFVGGAIDVATALPTTPTERDGYPLMTARAAVTQLTAGKSCCAKPFTRLRITTMTLTDHAFLTDRGQRSLPAFRLHFDGVPDDVFVLAVAASARYPQRLSSSPSTAGAATLSQDGRRLTVWVVAHHISADPCDIGYRQTMTSAQHDDAVQVAVATRYSDSPRPLFKSGDSTPCDHFGGGVNRFVAPTPGAPDTRTITLDKPLGNRIVVDQHGMPYVVTTS